MEFSAGDAVRTESGFTLIELLVVVIILGILAAIAIPVFLNQRDQAQDAAAKSIVRNAATTLISYHTEHGGFPLGDEASEDEMKEIQPSIDWRRSRGAPAVNLNTSAMVGAVPFERYLSDNPNGAVFGTRSASGECFYMRIDANGTRYGSDAQCDDPYETSDDGRITASGW